MKFSVITINYNNKEGLSDTLKSVSRQTYKDYEYIIIDGASTDGSVEIIKENAKYINYWVSEQDYGIYNAMNKGVSRAHGDYCIFMNSGDCFYNESVLLNISKEIGNEDIIVGRVYNNCYQELSARPTRNISLYHLYSGAIPHQGAFIKTFLLKENPYDESLRISADWKFFIQTIIFKNCSFRYTDVRIAIYDTQGVSSQKPALMRKEKEQYLKEILPERLLSDYVWMKSSECLTNTLTSQLKKHYCIDKLLYRMGKLLLSIVDKKL